MAVAFVSTDNGGNSTGTALSVTKPADVQSGDVVIAFIVLNGGSAAGQAASENNGSTPFTDSGLGVRRLNGDSATYYIKYRVCGASEPSSYNWTAVNSDRWRVILSVYRGVDNASVFDVAPTSSSENLPVGVTTVSTKEITTLTNNAMVVAVAAEDNSSFTFTATPADSFNSRANVSGTQLAALADKLIVTATTQGIVSWTSSNTNDPATNVFSLKAAAVAGQSMSYIANPVATLSS